MLTDDQSQPGRTNPGSSTELDVVGEPVAVASAVGSSPPDQPVIDLREPAEPEPEGGRGSRFTLMVNTFWSLAAEGLRLVSSLLTFLLLTRIYNPEEFGILVATMSLFAFVFPQASVGAGWLVLRRVASEDWEPADALARAAGMVIVGGLAFGLAMLAIRPLLLPQASLSMFLGLGFTELFLVGMVEVTLFAAQAREKLVVKAAAWTVYGVGRALAALLILLTIDDPDLGPWILANVVIAGLVLAIAQYLTAGRLVRPVAPRWIDLRQGVQYSVGFGADRLRDVTDTVTLVRFDYESDAGLYSAARRLVNVTQSPIVASLHAVNARIWKAGSRSAAEARSIALRCSGVGLVYGLVVAAVLIGLGGTLAGLLDDSFAETGTVLRWLSVAPLLLALEIFPGMALTASGYHPHRVVITLLAGLLNLGLNLAWVPDNGWRGAVAATLLSSALYVIGLWIVLNWAVGHQRRRGEVAA